MMILAAVMLKTVASQGYAQQSRTDCTAGHPQPLDFLVVAIHENIIFMQPHGHALSGRFVLDSRKKRHGAERHRDGSQQWCADQASWPGLCVASPGHDRSLSRLVQRDRWADALLRLPR